MTLFATLLSTGDAYAHSTCATVNDTPRTLPQGDAVTWQPFSDGDGNGVPNNFLASDDFGGNHCRRWIVSGDHLQRIEDDAVGTGEVSVYQMYNAGGGSVWSAEVDADIVSYNGLMRGVLRISAFSSPSQCLVVDGACWERSKVMCIPNDGGGTCTHTDQPEPAAYQNMRLATITMPAGTNQVKIYFRARKMSSGINGTVAMDRFFVRHHVS
ncbi:MAG TPA: hypothetical protein VHN37_11370 [Actinomycetota bacterium]|nr:hypothetical protein [Actinomycetota bacterium]